jgi:carbamoyl-phosphate synthase large subunit
MIIGISGLNNTDNPAPGVGVGKSLKGHRLIGLSYDPNEPGVYQNIFERVFLMPYPTLGFQELFHRLQYIQRETGLEGVIPTLDAELSLYIKYQDRLHQELGLKTCLPTLSQFEAREKRRLGELAEKLGISYPKTYEIFSIDELIRQVRKSGFPVMVKGNYYKAYRASNLEEAVDYFYKISNEWGFPILIQEVVEGEEINYLGLSREGELLGGIGIRKLTTTELGKIWTGVTIENRELLELALRFTELTGWNGAFELECIASRNQIYLIEINPRFPAWVYFGTGVGVNLPEMMVQIIEGKVVKPQLSYPPERMYVRYVDELITDFNLFKKLFSEKEL